MSDSQNKIVQDLETILSVDQQSPLCVAFSGGLDSTVLLHALVQQVTDRPLRALHINHQLQDGADDWQAHCRRFCQDHAVSFQAIRVATEAFQDLGIEGAARAARYQAFSENLGRNEWLLTAHHADDQVETMLLALMRGSGASGLAACAPQRPLGQGQLIRPLLDISRQQLQQYAEQHQLSWIDDPSNQSLVFDRNYLRHQVVPQLAVRWPQLNTTISRSIAWQSEQSQLLADLAASDLMQLDLDVVSTYGSLGSPVSTLDCNQLLALSPVRQRNVLRYWISSKGFVLPSAAVLEQIRTAVLSSGSETSPRVQWGEAEIRCYRQQLYLQTPLAEHDASQCLSWNLQQDLNLPSLGIVLTSADLSQQGLKLPQVTQVQVRFRSGGESIRVSKRACSKDLKGVFQEFGLPPWLRDRIPLIFYQDELICVWNIAISDGY
ncbi:MAG: tRNA lysidine(34) synthetase TilS [Gammaproteobacteria bacterium]|nr:tRNA lysidine(34) synthetase TilS [Gammaproteobacteria bacterium]